MRGLSLSSMPDAGTGYSWKNGQRWVMTPAVLAWYLGVAGPQGGLVVLPTTFDKREQCTAAITEYQKQPTPAGWSMQWVPSASPYLENGSAE